MDHRKLRRIIQRISPRNLRELTEAWDGKEDIDIYLARVATWAGTPVTAAEILAAEPAYDASELVRETEIARNADPVADSIDVRTLFIALKAKGVLVDSDLQ